MEVAAVPAKENWSKHSAINTLSDVINDDLASGVVVRHEHSSYSHVARGNHAH